MRFGDCSKAHRIKYHSSFDKADFVSVKLTYLKKFGFNFKVQIFLEGQKNLKKNLPLCFDVTK